MSARAHPLFDIYPLDGERDISVGPVPTPYHVYDGQGLLVGGTADTARIGALLQKEDVYPIQTRDGRALMGLWVVDFTEASLGPHQELQFTILVSHRPAAPVDDHAFALLKALFVNQDTRMFCHRLWNDSPIAVAYNRELLALPAAPARGTIQCSAEWFRFRFIDETDKLLCEGDVRIARRTPLQAGWALLRQFGLRQTLRAFSQPYLEAKVVNPVSESLPYNADAQSFLAADTPVVRFFDRASERIAFGEPYRNAFDFRPQFVEYFSPFRFVYLQPEAKADSASCGSA
jgi:hypothetical protein